MNVLLRGLDPGLLALIDSEVARAPRVVGGATRNAVIRALIVEAISARRLARGEDVFVAEPVGREEPIDPELVEAEAKMWDAIVVKPADEYTASALSRALDVAIGPPRRIGVPKK